MNTKLRAEAKIEFENDLLKVMNKSVFVKTMENVRKCRDIKLVTTDQNRDYLLLQSNYHIIKWYSENLLTIKMSQTKVKLNKPVYLGLSVWLYQTK